MINISIFILIYVIITAIMLSIMKPRAKGDRAITAIVSLVLSTITFILLASLYQNIGPMALAVVGIIATMITVTIYAPEIKQKIVNARRLFVHKE